MTWFDNFLKIEVTLKAYWTLQPFVVKRHEFWATEQFHEIVLTLVFFREKKTFLKSQLTTEVRAALFEERRLIRRSLKAPHFFAVSWHFFLRTVKIHVNCGQPNDSCKVAKNQFHQITQLEHKTSFFRVQSFPLKEF